MKTLQLLLLAFFVVTVELAKKCPYRSFTKLRVQVEDIEQTHTETVKQCISSDTLLYNKLKKIIISDQNISSLKKGFIHSIPVEFILRIHHNNVEVVEEEAFSDLPQVKEIDLDHNLIEWIETNAFDNLYLLSAIDLSHNKIEQLLQSTFNNLPNLKIIAFSNNKLKFFNQEWFYKANNLEMMYLDHNQIISIPKAAFITLPSLQNLDLSNNHIMYIHKYAFQGLNLLTELLLEDNWLKIIEVDFQLNPVLKCLTLSNNNITYISDNFLSGLENSLSSLWMHANPLQCNCFDKVIRWGQGNKIKVSWKCNMTELYCVIPKRKTDKCILRSDADFYGNFSRPFEEYCNRVIE